MHPGKLINRAGTRIHHQTCLGDSGMRGAARQVLWLWLCDCGNMVKRTWDAAQKYKNCGECRVVVREKKVPRPEICIDDPVRTPSGRPAVVRALHNDGRIDVRYTDELRDPGCTLLAAMVVKRPRKTPGAAVPWPVFRGRHIG